MNIIEAAGRVTAALAEQVADEADLERLLGERPAGAGAEDGGPRWAARELAATPAGAARLRLLAAAPGGDRGPAAVAAGLIRRALEDPRFAAELTRQVASSAPAAGKRQSATATGGGIAANALGRLDASAARIVGGDDNSRRIEQHGAGATAIGHPVTTVTGSHARVHIGTKVRKHRIFVPLTYISRAGRSAVSAASAHPAVAVAVCTTVVAGTIVGAVALAPSSPSALTAAPASFTGLWQGTVTQAGKSPYSAEVAITGGPLDGTVGSVNLSTLPCTSTLTLSGAQQARLTIKDTATSGGCLSGTLVLIPDGNDLLYTTTYSDGSTASGLLTRIQSPGTAAGAGLGTVPATAADAECPNQYRTATTGPYKARDLAASAETAPAGLTKQCIEVGEYTHWNQLDFAMLAPPSDSPGPGGDWTMDDLSDQSLTMSVDSSVSNLFDGSFCPTFTLAALDQGGPDDCDNYKDVPAQPLQVTAPGFAATLIGGPASTTLPSQIGTPYVLLVAADESAPADSPNLLEFSCYLAATPATLCDDAIPLVLKQFMEVDGLDPSGVDGVQGTIAAFDRSVA